LRHAIEYYCCNFDVLPDYKVSPDVLANVVNGTAIPSADCAGVDVNASPAERTREFFLFFSVCLFN
ncbi:hypothetical protein, partial [Klebsiella pneumoniae]|uniref:hypothetical protein n=1 Tax=Klebsiella pneumoniae TaxID=573 RepID=UPI001C46B4D3